MNIHPGFLIAGALGFLGFVAVRTSQRNKGMNDAPSPYMAGIPYFATNPSMYGAIPGVIGSPNAAATTPLQFDTTGVLADLSGYFERSLAAIRAASERIYVDNNSLLWLQASADLGGPTAYYGQGGAGAIATMGIENMAVPGSNPFIGSDPVSLEAAAAMYGTNGGSAGDFSALGVVQLYDPNILRDGSADDGRDGLGPTGKDAPNSPSTTPDAFNQMDQASAQAMQDFKDAMAAMGQPTAPSRGYQGTTPGTYGGGENESNAGPGNASNQGNADNPAQDQTGGIGAGSIGGSGGGSSGSTGGSGPSGNPGSDSTGGVGAGDAGW